MKIKNVLLSTKKTALEHFKGKSDFFEELLSLDDLKEIRQGHNDHYRSFNKIREILTKKGIAFERTYMPYSEDQDFKGKDLIICIGGDGTVLNSAHYIDDKTPILTVKSDRRSVGALCEIDAEEFEVALERIINDEFSIDEWTRIEGKIGDKKLIALNEIYVGVEHSVGMARYDLTHNGKTEFQKSSGVVITTGTGSTGWYTHIPGAIGKFSRNAKELRYIVRDAEGNGYQMVSGTINPGDKFCIKSKMNIDGCISTDGDFEKRMFKFNKGDEIELHIANTPVYVVTFKNS
jgi:NAD kinase